MAHMTSRSAEHKVKTNLSIRPEVRRRLNGFAELTSRTLSASVELLVTEALDARHFPHEEGSVGVRR